MADRPELPPAGVSTSSLMFGGPDGGQLEIELTPPPVVYDEFHPSPYLDSPRFTLLDHVPPPPSTLRVVADFGVPLAIGGILGFGSGLACGPGCAVAGGSIGAGAGRALVSWIADDEVDWVDAGVTAGVTGLTGVIGLGAGVLTASMSRTIPRLVTTAALTAGAGNAVGGGAVLLMTGDEEAALETALNYTNFGINLGLSLGLHASVRFTGWASGQKWGPVGAEAKKIADYFERQAGRGELKMPKSSHEDFDLAGKTPKQIGIALARRGYSVADLEYSESLGSKPGWMTVESNIDGYVQREVNYRWTHGLPPPESGRAIQAQVKEVADHFRDRPHSVYRSWGEHGSVGREPLMDALSWVLRDKNGKIIETSGSPEGFAGMLRTHGIFTVEDAQKAGITRAPTVTEQINELATLLKTRPEELHMAARIYLPDATEPSAFDVARQIYRVGYKEFVLKALSNRIENDQNLPPEARLIMSTHRIEDALLARVLLSLKAATGKNIDQLPTVTEEGVKQLAQRLAASNYSPLELSRMNFEVMGEFDSSGRFVVNIDESVKKTQEALVNAARRNVHAAKIESKKPD